MIRSALRSLSYLVEDMVSVVKWAVGEAIAEIDYRLVQLDHRLQPEHVRQGWAAELADIEAGIDVHEPNAPYLSWGGPETWNFKYAEPDPYCNRCGYPHPTTQTCKMDEAVESKPVTSLYVKCSYPMRPNAVALSDMCQRSATTAVRTLDGKFMYRCPTHEALLSEGGYGVVYHSVPVSQSSAVPPTAERPSEVSAAPPSQTPSEGHPLFTTSLLLEQGAIYAEVLAEMEKDEDTAEWHRIDAAAMRERAEAFKAIEDIRVQP